MYSEWRVEVNEFLHSTGLDQAKWSVMRAAKDGGPRAVWGADAAKVYILST